MEQMMREKMEKNLELPEKSDASRRGRKSDRVLVGDGCARITTVDSEKRMDTTDAIREVCIVENSGACPGCGSPIQEAKVVDSRSNQNGGGKRRRRQCSCGQRYSTQEVVVGAGNAIANAQRVEREAIAKRLKEFAQNLLDT